MPSAKVLTYGIAAAVLGQIAFAQPEIVNFVALPAVIQPIIERFIASPALQMLVGSLGGDLLVGVIDKVASSKDATNEQILEALETQLTKEMVHTELVT